jgi:hypothetical protein
MNTGMLWFDGDGKTDLITKIGRAARYYQEKYGRRPDLCFVHPSMLAQKNPLPDGFEVRSSEKVLPNHFWLGINLHKSAAAA